MHAPRRRRILAAGLASLAALSLAGKVSAEAATAPVVLAEVRGTGADGVVPGAYIVVLKSPASGVRTASASASRRVDGAAVGLAAGRARARGSKVERQFTGALPGFSARMDAAQLAAVRRDPAVAYVEADRRVDGRRHPERRRPGVSTASTSAPGRSTARTSTAPTGAGVTRVRHRHRHPRPPTRSSAAA